MSSGVKFTGISLRDQIVYLKWYRIGRTPPAQYASEILHEKGYPVRVVEFGALEEPELQPRSKNSHTPPKIRLGCSWAKKFPRVSQPVLVTLNVLWQLSRSFTKNGRPKLLVAHGLQEQLVCWLLKLTFRVEYAVQVHEPYTADELSPNNKLFFLFEGVALRAASLLVFPERERRTIYVDRYRIESESLLAFNCPRLRKNPTEPIDVRKQIGVAESTRLIAYMGGIGEPNAPRELIESMKYVPGAHLVFWGWGEETYVATLRKIAADHGVGNRVHFLGMCEDKWANVSAVDVCYCVYRGNNLRLTHQATASNKLTEAAALGIPVIANGNPDFREAVEGHDIGICLDEITPENIGQALNTLLNDEVGYRRRVRNARKLHLTEWNFEHQFAQVTRAMQKLTGIVPGAPRERGTSPRSSDQPPAPPQAGRRKPENTSG